jgi:glutamyl-tRNA reductase
MVADEVARIERWLETRQSGPAIARLRERAESLVTDEVSRALSGLDLSDQARARIEHRMNTLGMRVANKLLHGPTTSLREADDATRGTIMRILGLD